jgi:hypothetical protein
MLFTWVGTRCAGVIVIYVAAMSVAIMPVLKALDGTGGCAAAAVGSGSTATAAVVAAASVETAATAIAATTAAAVAAAAIAAIMFAAAVIAAAAAVVASAAAVKIPIENLGAAMARSAATASLAYMVAAGREGIMLGGAGLRVPGRASESAPAWR